MEKLYWEDSYLKEFKAEITSIFEGENGLEIMLSQSAFYPESGGQPSDHGWINDIPLLNLVDTPRGTMHVLPSGEFSAGQEVSCRIDWARRFDHMQHHTGQHLLSQVFLETCSAETLSFHLGSDSATIDLSVESLPDEILQNVELRANQVITDNLPVKVYSIDGAEQKQLAVRKPSERTGLVRIVEISGWDYSPCGGTHCKSTGEIGLIKIVRLERVRQLLRVHFCCGKRAFLDYRNKDRILSNLAKLLSCGAEDLPGNVQKMAEENRESSKQVQKLQSSLMSLTAEQMGNNLISAGEFKLAAQFVEGAGMKDLNRLASSILKDSKANIVLLAGNHPRPCILFARSNDPRLPDLRQVLAEVQPLFDGKGGGSPDRVQAGGSNPAGLDTALERAREMIIEIIED